MDIKITDPYQRDDTYSLNINMYIICLTIMTTITLGLIDQFGGTGGINRVSEMANSLYSFTVKATQFLEIIIIVTNAYKTITNRFRQL